MKKFWKQKNKNWILSNDFHMQMSDSQIRNVEIVFCFEIFDFERFEILQNVDDVILICMKFWLISLMMINRIRIVLYSLFERFVDLLFFIYLSHNFFSDTSKISKHRKILFVEWS